MAAGLAFQLACVVAVGGLLVHRSVERHRLRRFVRGLPLPMGDQRTRCLALAGRLHHLPPSNGDPPYLTSLLLVFGSTPCAVIARGGCCSAVSRLYILCLAELGVRAHQITLYHVTGIANHCLVEAMLEDGPLIADPGYGVSYTDESGGPLGLAALQQGVRPVFHRLPGSDRAAYPPGPYYDFDFSRTRTVNWTRSGGRRAAYRILRRLTDGGVDRLRVPSWLEWPQVLIALLLTGFYASFHFLRFVLR